MSNKPVSPLSNVQLETPALPLDFVNSVLVERAIVCLRTWLKQNDAPNHVQGVFAGIEFGYNCLLIASKYGGKKLPARINQELASNAHTMVQALYLLAEEIGEPLDLGE